MTLDKRIEKYNKNGGFFFDSHTMRSFGSKIHDDLGDGYFITSEVNKGYDKRKYTIRRFNSDCTDVEDVGAFYQYISANAAKIAFRVIRRFDEMRHSAGYRENAILDNFAKVVPFSADRRSHDAYTIIANDGSSCIYDFKLGRFVG